MEPAEKEEYEQYVWDLAASFKNAAPSRRGARRHVLLPAPAGGCAQSSAGRRLHPDGGRPAGYFLQAARIAEARRGLRYHRHAGPQAHAHGRPCPVPSGPHVLPPPSSAASASAAPYGQDSAPRLAQPRAAGGDAARVGQGPVG